MRGTRDTSLPEWRDWERGRKARWKARTFGTPLLAPTGEVLGYMRRFRQVPVLRFYDETGARP